MMTRGWALLAARILLSVVGIGLPCAAYAQSSALPVVPSVKILKGPQVDPTDAATWYASQSQQSTDGLCSQFGDNGDICPGGARPRAPEVVELARALQHDPNLIYEYVRNRVDTEFIFGSNKGALGVIIDGSGSALDQATLMVELLRESGITASYKFGRVTLTGSEFLAWTGISNPSAARNFLSTGGIPASVAESGGAITSVTLDHVWVEAVIGGTSRFFDPAYKPYIHKTGIDLRAAVSFSSTAVSTAAGGSDQSTGTSGLTTVGQLNSSAVSSQLATSAAAVLTRLNQSDLQGADMDDVVGGRVIEPATRPSGGWLQSTPSSYTVVSTWAAGVPNIYRTTVNLYAAVSSTVYINSTFFTDEVYGRPMSVGAVAYGSPGSYQWAIAVDFDGVQLAVGPKFDAISPNLTTLQITMDHPFRGQVGTTWNAYGDAVSVKAFDPLKPALLVIAVGATSDGLRKKWGTEKSEDEPAIQTAFSPVAADVSFTEASGLSYREQTASTWLAQFNMAAEINGELANSRVTLLHTLGLISSAQQVAKIPEVPWAPDQEIAGQTVGFNGYDEVTVVDLETSFGVTSRTNDASARRGALQAIAILGAALEGSVIAQSSDSPDAASAVTRLAWGNDPETSETPVTGYRPLYRFSTTGSTSNVLSITTYEGTTGAVAAWNKVPIIPSGWSDIMRTRLSSTIQAYSTAGFDVVASSEANLGPGHRIGSEYPEYVLTVNRQLLGPLMVANTFCASGILFGPGSTTGYQWPPTVDDGVTGPSGDLEWIDTGYSDCNVPGSGAAGHLQYDGPGSVASGDTVTRSITSYARLPGLQRGGAIVATKYDATDTEDAVEIAYVMTRWGPTVKGGGGPGPSQLATFSPSEAAATLKDRFVDRSSALGVDLSSGQVGYSSPVLASVGPGEFPFRLERRAEMRPFPVGMVSNWDVTTEISSSGFEAMGQSRVQAAAPSLAAFMALQGNWTSQAKGARRELMGALVADWWTKQLLANVVTIQDGGESRQFVKVGTGPYLPTGRGAERLTVTGSRAVVRPDFVQQIRDSNTHQEDSILRGWDYSGVSMTLTGSSGDVRVFGYFALDTWKPPNKVTLDTSYLWRLNTWTFPQGVQLTLAYPTTLDVNRTAPISVTSNLGYSLTIPARVGNGILAAGVASPYCLEGVQIIDTLNGAICLELRKPVLRSPTQRPDPYNKIVRIFTQNDSSIPSVEYTYDMLGRVKEARDGVALRDYAAREPYEFFLADGYRGEREDPVGGRYAVETLKSGRMVRYTDELGRVVVAMLDGRGRVATRTYPEGDYEAFAYDIRDNMISLTRYPKPGSTLSPITTSLTLMEGASVLVCSNAKTCNSPASADGPRTDITDVTNYSWSSSTGLMTQVLKPSPDASSLRPQIDFSYTSYIIGGQNVTVLTGLTEKIDASTSVTTSLSYDTANHLLLKSMTADSGGIAATTCYQYNTVGDLVGVSDARTTSCPSTIQ